MKEETISILMSVVAIDLALPLGTVAEEEASELIKELCKMRRGKGSIARIHDEAIDTIVGALTLLFHIGVPWDQIEEGIVAKAQRTLRKYAETGEL